MHIDLEKSFTFLEGKYSLGELSSFERVKTYKESSHFDRMLLKDSKNNRLFLYEFYEYVNFNGGPDEMYSTYVLVKNEQEADELNKQRMIRRSPCFVVGPHFNIEVSDKRQEF